MRRLLILTVLVLLLVGTAVAQAAVLDTDKDGLPDQLEQAIGTKPSAADTDGDGLSDGVELAPIIDGVKSDWHRFPVGLSDTDNRFMGDPSIDIKSLTAISDGKGLYLMAEFHQSPRKENSYQVYLITDDKRTALFQYYPDTGFELVRGDWMECKGTAAVGEVYEAKIDLTALGTQVASVAFVANNGKTSDQTNTLRVVRVRHFSDPVNPDSDGDGVLDSNDREPYTANPSAVVTGEVIAPSGAAAVEGEIIFVLRGEICAAASAEADGSFAIRLPVESEGSSYVVLYRGDSFSSKKPVSIHLLPDQSQHISLELHPSLSSVVEQAAPGEYCLENVSLAGTWVEMVYPENYDEFLLNTLKTKLERMLHHLQEIGFGQFESLSVAVTNREDFEDQSDGRRIILPLTTDAQDSVNYEKLYGHLLWMSIDKGAFAGDASTFLKQGISEAAPVLYAMATDSDPRESGQRIEQGRLHTGQALTSLLYLCGKDDFYQILSQLVHLQQVQTVTLQNVIDIFSEGIGWDCSRLIAEPDAAALDCRISELSSYKRPDGRYANIFTIIIDGDWHWPKLPLLYTSGGKEHLTDIEITNKLTPMTLVTARPITALTIDPFYLLPESERSSNTIKNVHNSVKRFSWFAVGILAALVLLAENHRRRLLYYLEYGRPEDREAYLESLLEQGEIKQEYLAQWDGSFTTILATDVGSTTTKAILIEKGSNGFRLVGRGEAPTTVEAPAEDVTIGVQNAIKRLESLLDRQFLDDSGRLITPRDDLGRGVDLYISTSSAGGGLQMVVAGIMQKVTAESAYKAATGAGGIVMDVISKDDGRMRVDQIKRVRELRPDIILLSGGVDGGNATDVVTLAEVIEAAAPRSRLGDIKLPVVYAGNKSARNTIRMLLGESTDLRIVENIRPQIDTENLEPARAEVHNLFMDHVMAQAPGYQKLMKWTQNIIMPTPGAVGKVMKTMADKYGINIVGLDIGGATTDVFSVSSGQFQRTVSANLGMSYSATNVLAEAGAANILRWLPFYLSERNLRDRIANKMIRPTRLPETLDELIIEHALAREAIRLSFMHHQFLIGELKGVQKVVSMADFIMEGNQWKSAIDLKRLDVVIGSGGVLSHAPRRAQAMMIMLDAIQPEGITEVFVDSIFMMPQLGVLSTVNEQVALQVFEKDCLILLGTCVAPIGQAADGEVIADVSIKRDNGEVITKSIVAGKVDLIQLNSDEFAYMKVKPRRGFDVGAGRGKAVECDIEGGLYGVVLDGRGRRPLRLPTDPEQRIAKVSEWLEALDIYPAQLLRKYQQLYRIELGEGGEVL